MGKKIKYSTEDRELQELLIELLMEQYPHGDSFYAEKKLTGAWKFGSFNDNSLRHGNGYCNQLSESMAGIIFNKLKMIKL